MPKIKIYKLDSDDEETSFGVQTPISWGRGKKNQDIK